MKKILNLSLALILCACTFSVSSVNAAETDRRNTPVVIQPRYTQQVEKTISFYFRSVRYSLDTTWSIGVNNETGRLVSANLIEATSTLPDPYYQSTSVVKTERLSDLQVRYTLKVNIYVFGLLEGYDYVDITISSPGPI